MKEKHFWKIEYTITLLVIFSVIALMLPTSIKSTLQADLTTRWSDCYNKLSYMKDVIAKHEQENLLSKLKRTKNRDEREKIITLIIKPYFRLNECKYLKKYHPKYLNGGKILKGDNFYFPELFTGDNNIIVGFKNITENDPNSAMFMMMFDVNGILPPNTWGKDIYGAKIYDGKVEPLGKDLPLNVLKNDCSVTGSGVSCSYYYLIGGSFNE